MTALLARLTVVGLVWIAARLFFQPTTHPRWVLRLIDALGMAAALWYVLRFVGLW